MIGLDTNVLIRYLVQDDPDQAHASTALIESLTDEEPGYVSIVVLVECFWVLQRGYGYPPRDVEAVLRGLLNASEIRVAETEVVRLALRTVESGFDFADAVISGLGREAGCAHTMTLDRRAAKLTGMQLLA